jgi:hypothetical protein
MDALHVFALTSFAIAQPVYDRLSGRSAFLIDQAIGLPAICLLILLTSFALPAVFVLLGWIASRLHRNGYRVWFGAVVYVLLLLLALPVSSQVGFLPGVAVCLVALLLSAAATLCYFRFRQFRSIVTVAAVGILLFPAAYLLNSHYAAADVEVSADRTNKFQPIPVVMLVLDEFCGSTLMTPERQIDETRFPNFAALAKDATWFRNATSVSEYTQHALPAILSGTYAEHINKVRSSGELPQNLFSALALTGGYELAVFEPVSMLAPARLNRTDERPIGIWRQTGALIDTLARVYLFHVTPPDYYPQLPMIPMLWFGLHNHPERGAIEERDRGVFRYGWGQRRADQVRHFLKTIDGSSQPALHFMHVLLPHMPWCFLPSGRRHSEDGSDWHLLELDPHSESPGTWGADDLDVIHSQQRYLLQAMYVDKVIGQVVARLKETGQYDRCLLIVTADHGISFRPGIPRRFLTPENQDEILSIPLFIKRPGPSEGGVSDRAVESVDILPTIADVVGITLKSPVDGWSVFDTSRPERDQKRFGYDKGASKISPDEIVNSNAPRTVRQRFGDGSDPESLYRVGPIPELVGQPLNELDHSTPTTVELEFTRFGDTVQDSLDVEVPCYFEGQIVKPQDDAAVVLAVSINGTIRGVTRPYLANGFQDQFTVIVPENAFHHGKNEVQFFSVTGSGPKWQLSICQVKQATTSTNSKEKQ